MAQIALLPIAPILLMPFIIIFFIVVFPLWLVAMIANRRDRSAPIDEKT